MDPISQDGLTGSYNRTYLVNSSLETVNGGIVLGEATPTNSFTANAFFKSNGDMRLRGNFYMISDARLKTEIRPIDDALDKVDRIHGVYYKRTDKHTGRDEICVIAQEVQSVLPEAVDMVGDTLAVNYPGLIGVLIEGMKELRKENRVLKEQMERMMGALTKHGLMD